MRTELTHLLEVLQYLEPNEVLTAGKLSELINKSFDNAHSEENDFDSCNDLNPNN